MTEYQDLLEEYACDSYSFRTGRYDDLEWADVPVAEHYLEKYWLPKKEYEVLWKPIQNKIFINQDKGPPSEVFRANYQIITLGGGCLFTEEDFAQLQKCVRAVGDEYMIIVQNHKVQTSFPAPPFRMKFPSNISWDELMSGNYISAVLVDFDEYDYFVFGESGAWGKYLSNPWLHSLDIVGFKEKYAPLFKQVFTPSAEEKKDVYASLPASYKKYMV